MQIDIYDDKLIYTDEGRCGIIKEYKRICMERMLAHGKPEICFNLITSHKNAFTLLAQPWLPCRPSYMSICCLSYFFTLASILELASLIPPYNCLFSMFDYSQVGISSVGVQLFTTIMSIFSTRCIKFIHSDVLLYINYGSLL